MIIFFLISSKSVWTVAGVYFCYFAMLTCFDVFVFLSNNRKMLTLKIKSLSCQEITGVCQIWGLRLLHVLSYVPFPCINPMWEKGEGIMTWSPLRLKDFVWRWWEMLPHFLFGPLGNGPHSSLLAWLKTESQAQWNNCTKYSPAVTIETSTGASLTSPTVFHFALDPEKHWEVDV